MRPSWDDYFVGMLKAVSRRASCDRGMASAIIVKDKRILSCGYVGAPSGLPDCDKVGHDLVRVATSKVMKDQILGLNHIKIDAESNIVWDSNSTHCIRTIHAELNAILNAARNGVSCLDATMYCTMVPCKNCAMAIIQAGIIKVIAKYLYREQPKTKEMFDELCIPLMILSNETDPTKFE